MILVYTVFTPNSRPQVRKPIIRSMTFRIIVIADSGSGMKLDSTIPRPEILLTEVWLGTRKKYTAVAMIDSNGQYDCFYKDFCVIQLCFHKRKSFFIFKVLFNSELPDLEDLP